MAEMNLDKYRLFADLSADDVSTLLGACEEPMLVGGEERAVTVHLSGGVAIHGRILQMDHQPAGHTLILKDRNQKIAIVPYHAIQRIEL